MLGKVMGFVATKKPEIAKKFYSEALGLKLIADDPFAVVLDSGGTMIRVQKLRDSQTFIPVEGTQLGWQVEDIKAEVKSLSKKGIEFQRFPGMNQDDLGVWTSPAGAKVAWFKDPDGNNLSLTQFP